MKVSSNAVIFIGVPLNTPYSSPSDFSKVQPVRFKIERRFQGLPDETQFVEVDTAAASSCEAVFSKGMRYIVYAEGDSTPAPTLTTAIRRLFYGESSYSGRVFTSQCKGSKQVERAADDLKFLEAFVVHRTVMSIQGQVYADTGQGNDHLYDRIQKRLTGSSVSVSSADGHQYSAIADAAGRFQIKPVQTGRYKVRIQQAKFRSALAEYDLSVPEGGCGVISIPMGFDGSVSGRLREPSGSSPIPVKVQLIPVLSGDVYPLPLETISAADGTYVFHRVPLGWYVLAVNASDEPTKKTPYKRVFYSGVEDRSGAKLIHVEEAERVLNANFTLSARLNPRTITAEMIWADGTPARYVHTWCAPTGYSPSQHLLTDGEGRITFPAMDGLAYEIGAAAASNYEITTKQRVSAYPVRVSPGPSISVRLVLSIPPR